MLGKEKLVFDTTNTEEGDNTGAYLRASDGTLITKTTDVAKQRLDISSGAEHYDGTAYTAGDKGSFALAVNPSGDYAPLRVNASGELLVDVQISSGADKAEDSAHVSGDIGAYVLSVREDTLATSTSATGDYQSFKTDSLGALWVNSYKQAPASNNSWKVTQNTINTTAELVVATDLVNRKRIIIQNVSTLANAVYLAETNAVTSGNGIRLSSGSSVELDLAAGVNIYAIAFAPGADLRIAEMAYA